MAASLSSLAVAVALAVALVGAVPAAAARGDAVRLMFSQLRRDSSLLGGATVTATAADGVVWEATTAQGNAGVGLAPVGLDSCIGLATASELLVAAAAVLLLGADDAPSRKLDAEVVLPFTAGSVALTNAYTAAGGIPRGPVKYKDLLTHTSTLMDTAAFDQRAGVVAASPPTPTDSDAGAAADAAALERFLRDVLLSSSGSTLVRENFRDRAVGIAESFEHARMNTAVLSFVLDQTLRTRFYPAMPASARQPVSLATSGGATTLQEFVAMKLLVPLGMASTFFVASSGAAPGVEAPPDYSLTDGKWSRPSTKPPASAYHSFFDGCIADRGAQAALRVHPAPFADYGGFTTPLDLSRLVSGLFLETGPLPRVAAALRELTPLAVPAARSGHVGQGLGLMYFDGDAVCAEAAAVRVLSVCPLTNRSTVFGYATVRGTTQVGVFCYTSDVAPRGAAPFVPSQTAPAVACVTTMLAYAASVDRSGTPPAKAAMALAAAAAQDLHGVYRVSTPSPGPELRSGEDEKLFGVSVFFAVYGSVVFVVFGTRLLQFVLQPAALAVTTTTAAATYAMTGADVSPRRSGVPFEGMTPKDA